MPHRASLATLALLLSTAACGLDLPPGDVKSPDYWGDFFLDKYADELALEEVELEVEPAPVPLEKPRVVLLITGVTIPAEWFEPMEARLERDGFIPVVYEPPDLLSGSLFENSELLGVVIDDVLEEYGEDKLDILAECTGGVIARHYVQSLGGESKVSRLVTFISPQAGLPKAPFAAKFAGWPALYDLSPGSEFLDAVADAPLPESVPITSIYSCTDEYIQPYSTSIIPGATNIGLCDGFVGHFEFFWNPDIYLIMHDALTQPLPEEKWDADDDAETPAEPGEDGGKRDDPHPRDESLSDEDDDATAAGCSVGGRPSATPAALFVLLACAAATRRRARSA